MGEFIAPSLKELLDKAAEKWGNQPFVSYIKNGDIISRSFSEVREDSFAVCRKIRHSIPHKVNAAVIGKTSYEYLIASSGVLLSGNTFVPLSPDISAKEASELLGRIDASLVIYEEDFSDKARELKELCPGIKYMFNMSDEKAQERIREEYSSDSEFASLSDIEVDKNDCAAIIFTSGTTGVKKGVMLSTNSLIGNIMYQDYCADIFNEQDTSLSVLPMYHVYCFSGDYIKNLKDGVRICLNGSLRDIVNNLIAFQPRVVRVVPLIAQSLLQRVKMIKMRNPDLSPREAAETVFGKNIKWLISGGAYLNPELIEEYDKLGIFLRQGYGMTEAGCRISVPDETVARDSVGRVIDICSVRIQGDEIQIKTPTAMLGYYNMPEETAQIFTDDGWLKTGDIGYVTEDRQLFITGRAKNLIILSGGENVSPEAIEKKFNAVELVDEVMVYGEKDRIVAEIYPNFDYAEANDIEDIKSVLESIVDGLNETAKASHIISRVKIREIPFEKTGAGKIKRYETKI